MGECGGKEVGRWGEGHAAEEVRVLLLYCLPRRRWGVDGVQLESTSLALSSLVNELLEERKELSRFMP
jgi:hypothetical protein